MRRYIISDEICMMHKVTSHGTENMISVDGDSTMGDKRKRDGLELEEEKGMKNTEQRPNSSSNA